MRQHPTRLVNTRARLTSQPTSTRGVWPQCCHQGAACTTIAWTYLGGCRSTSRGSRHHGVPTHTKALRRTWSVVLGTALSVQCMRPRALSQPSRFQAVGEQSSSRPAGLSGTAQGSWWCAACGGQCDWRDPKTESWLYRIVWTLVSEGVFSSHVCSQIAGTFAHGRGQPGGHDLRRLAGAV